MSIDRKNADSNHQGHPHQEGQQSNMPPAHEADGQRRRNTQTQSMSKMMNESDEQKAGPAHGQKDDQCSTRGAPTLRQLSNYFVLST